MPKKYTLAVLACCLLLALISGWFLLFRFNTITSPFESDEGEYAYAAQLMHEGGIPYKEDFMQKPPMIVYVYYTAQFISTKTYAPRLIALLFLVLTTFVVGVILKKEYNRNVACIFLILFPPLVSLPFFSGLDAQPEIFLLLPLVLSIWCYFVWRRNTNNWLLICMGGLGAIACLFKPIILPAYCFIFVWVLFTNLTQFSIVVLTRFLYLLAGFVALSTLIVLPIALRGGLAAMWDSAFVYNYYYSSVFGLQLTIFFGVLKTIWPLLLLALWFIYKKPAHWLFFTGLFIASFIGTAASILLHYYIIMLPALCIIAAVSIDMLAKQLQSPQSKYTVLIFAFPVLLIIFFWYPYRDRFLMDSQETSRAQFYTFPFRESVLMAEKVAAITQATDRIFIYGNQPQILYYAHRKSSTRFVITYPVTIYTPLVDTYTQELEKGLEQDPPAVIITEGMPPLKKLLSRHGALSPLKQYMTTLVYNQYEFVGAVITDDDHQYTFQTTNVAADDAHVQLALFKRKSN